MSEAIICAVIAALAAVIVGIVNANAQRRTKREISEEIQKQKADEIEKENAHKDFEIHVIKGIMAAVSLSEATARAVQRIPDAHCNGDMTSALEEEAQVKKEIQLFLARQGINNIID